SSSALLVVCGLCESEPPVRGVKAGAAGTPRFMNRVRFAVGECVLPAPRAQEVWTTRVFLLRRRNFCVTHAWEGTVSVATPHPPRPPYPPPVGDPGESDEFLAARLRDRPAADAARPAARLTARHWPSMLAPATLGPASPWPPGCGTVRRARPPVPSRC